MIANINEAVEKIKKIGASNARIVPMPNENAVTGLHQIDIREGQSWVTVVSGITKSMGEDLVSQATNRTILG